MNRALCLVLLVLWCVAEAACADKRLPNSSGTPDSLRAAIVDLSETFGAAYPNGPKYLARLDRLEGRLGKGDKAGEWRVEVDLAALLGE